MLLLCTQANRNVINIAIATSKSKRYSISVDIGNGNGQIVMSKTRRLSFEEAFKVLQMGLQWGCGEKKLYFCIGFYKKIMWIIILFRKF